MRLCVPGGDGSGSGLDPGAVGGVDGGEAAGALGRVRLEPEQNSVCKSTFLLAIRCLSLQTKHRRFQTAVVLMESVKIKNVRVLYVLEIVTLQKKYSNIFASEN